MESSTSLSEHSAWSPSGSARFPADRAHRPDLVSDWARAIDASPVFGTRAGDRARVRMARSTERRYWNPPESVVPRGGQAIARVRTLFDEAVRKRLVADVPVGAFLSGGVDSSALVASMAAQSKTVRTFTIGFEEQGYSEVEHARRIAQRYGTDHHEFVVRPDMTSVLPLLVRHYGEPYADSSAVPTYYLSKLTRDFVTVALAGDGGDELFAGYQRYHAVRLAAALDHIPAALRGPILGGAQALLPRSGDQRAGSARLRRFISGARASATVPPWLGSRTMSSRVERERRRRPRRRAASKPNVAWRCPSAIRARAQLLDVAL